LQPFTDIRSTHLTPTQVAVYVNVNPMVAIILGAALLAEEITGALIGGFVAVVVGVLFVNWPRKIESE
jgi:drug/metabolite transporter (DMT)-like permease